MTDVAGFTNLTFEECVEILDKKELSDKLKAAEAMDAIGAPGPSDRLKIGLIYHEAALNFGMQAAKPDRRKGYAKKSYDLLEELASRNDLSSELRVWILAYRASALALLSGEKGSLGLLSRSFKLFEGAIEEFDGQSYLPRFMRGSVAENLPWIFWKKRSFAREDFDVLVRRTEVEPAYLPDRIKSFTYWAWAMQFHSIRASRPKAVLLLKEAMKLDPDRKAGYSRAKALLERLGSSAG